MARLAPLLNRLIGEDIALTWNTESGVWPIEIDPSQFEQVITNLVVNARDALATTAMISATITVTITNVTLDTVAQVPNPSPPPGDYVRITVTDNGPGLDDEIQAKIFEPFFTTRGTGHGLGLSTVHGIVQQSNGVISLISSPGQGATFEVLFPRHRGPFDPHPEHSAPRTDFRCDETILVAEDEPALLALLTKILQDAGYTVLAASDATEALRLACDHPTTIDLLLTDLVMPDSNGRELATRLTAAGIHTRHLFMSGYTADVDRPEATTAFLQKPFTRDALTTKIRDILDTEPEPAPQ